MKFIAINDLNEICFKDDSINIITETDRLISDEIYAIFFEQQSMGKQFRIKNLEGTTFEEIFEEYQPENNGSEDLPGDDANQQLSEIDELKQRIADLESMIQLIKPAVDVLMLDAGVVDSRQST